MTSFQRLARLRRRTKQFGIIEEEPRERFLRENEVFLTPQRISEVVDAFAEKIQNAYNHRGYAHFVFTSPRSDMFESALEKALNDKNCFPLPKRMHVPEDEETVVAEEITFPHYVNKRELVLVDAGFYAPSYGIFKEYLKARGASKVKIAALFALPASVDILGIEANPRLFTGFGLGEERYMNEPKIYKRKE